MKLKIKLYSPLAKIPTRGSEGAAGYDLYASSGPIPMYDGFSEKRVKYYTGVAIEIPEGYVGLIFPRSSIYKTGFSLSNSVGVIDSDYRGEISFIFNRIWEQNSNNYKIGDRIGQLVVMKYDELHFEEVNELPDTKRGTGGFGSTGK